MIRRAGIIGDIHAEHEILAAVLVFLDQRGVDGIFSVGDIVDGRGSVDRCCDLLQRFDVVTVAGNHERWFLSGVMRDLPLATQDGEVSARS